MIYTYILEGIGGNGTTWKTSGTIVSHRGRHLPLIVNAALQQSLQALTHGEVEFGKPGVGGCHGPYRFTKLVVEMAINGDEEENT